MGSGGEIGQGAMERLYRAWPGGARRCCLYSERVGEAGGTGLERGLIRPEDSPEAPCGCWVAAVYGQGPSCGPCELISLSLK